LHVESDMGFSFDNFLSSGMILLYHNSDYFTDSCQEKYQQS